MPLKRVGKARLPARRAVRPKALMPRSEELAQIALRKIQRAGNNKKGTIYSLLATTPTVEGVAKKILAECGKRNLVVEITKPKNYPGISFSQLTVIKAK